MAVESFSASLTCERTLAKAVIGGVIRAILFQRAFGTSVPGSQQICGVTLPYLASAELDGVVETRVDEIHAATRAGKKVVVLIEFCEEKTRRTWYSKSVEEIPWEEYKLTIEVVSGQTERDRSRLDSLTKSQLSAFVMNLLVFADAHKSHTPPITTGDVLPFPWRITLLPTSRS